MDNHTRQPDDEITILVAALRDCESRFRFAMEISPGCGNLI